MRIEEYPMKSAQPLAEAYIHRTDERVQALYGYHPGIEEDWQKRLDYLKASVHLRADTSALADVLRVYNEKASASPAVFDSIAAIAEGQPVIVGGQQAGLWTGPLLVIHKAVSIISSAKAASQQLGLKVVPVFWIAGEDHDWDEANHAYVTTSDNELHKLAASRPERHRTSVSRTKISNSEWQQLLAELEQALPLSEFRPRLLEQLREMSQQANSLSDMFAKILIHIFGQHGLVVLDADDPNLRQLEAPMFKRLIEMNDELERSYHYSAQQIQELGYPLQADVAKDCANLFYFLEDEVEERLLLHKREGNYHDRKNQVSLSKQQLLLIASEQPYKLSNNVLTRPLMQDYLLPVLSTVLGTGEIAYWALTGEAFRTLGMEMPIIAPRMSYTLIEGTIAKHMDKYELSFEDVIERFKRIRDQWLMDQGGSDIEEKFAEAKHAFELLYKPILAQAASIQPSLSKLGDTNLQKITEQIDYMSSKTMDAFNKKFEVSTRQLDRISLSIKPQGKLQERVLNMTAYWNRYGLDFVDLLLDAPYSRTGGHYIIYL